MKIKQKKAWKPIKIKLETPKEADDFWDAIESCTTHNKVSLEICNAFSDKLSVPK